MTMFSQKVRSLLWARLLLLLLSFLVPSQSQVVSPLVELCGPTSNTTSIVCVSRYSAVLPNHFFRAPINNTYFPTAEPSYEQTAGINKTDPSFELLSNASFVVWDRKRALPLLSSNAKNEFIFQTTVAVTDAPVYAPDTNELYFSELIPNFLAQNVINLTASPPTLSNKTAKPPIYSAQGGVFHDGLIYYAVGGGNDSYNIRPGIYTLDATSGESKVLLNNYFGWYLNGPDDLTFDPVNGDIWFTDPAVAWGNSVNDKAPVLPLQTYRFRPSTGLLTVVEDTLLVPNGIAASPDGKTLYISDTGAVSDSVLQQYRGYFNFNVTSHHTVYAFDIVRNTAGEPYLANKRPIFMSKDWIPDGLKVSREGYVLTGTGSSVEVLDPEGELLLSIQTNYTAVNMNWAGQDLDELWIVGFGGVSRVTGLNIHGQPLS